MEKNEQISTPKRPTRISPELAEVLKMLSALENREAPKPDSKAA
jgi:hypothetical protein